NKFMVTMLSRENQHELCVAARKYRNLMIFGCWWFLNNPMLIEEMTRMRFELLGLSFIPQHSDARVMDQLIYKWKHSRKIISRVLADKYTDLIDSGWKPSPGGIKKDVDMLFGGNFNEFERMSL
ncbi:MAG: glucuronate isomerase, partial [Clostridia bacterium]|nr:glucuronate isomerase [Clostridia bacterium]